MRSLLTIVVLFCVFESVVFLLDLTFLFDMNEQI
jgi:hypothetical protein